MIETSTIRPPVTREHGKSGNILYVGCRTTKERNARGRGIGVFRHEGSRGWQVVQILEGLENPSYLALDRSGTRLYAIHGDRTEISSLAIDPQSGRLGLLGTTSTEGRNPVHLTIDPSGRFVLVANHLTSSVALLPLGPDGNLHSVCDLFVLAGELGPHRREQFCVKPHQVVFDPSGKFVFIPDKGIDGIHVLRLDTANRRLVPAPFPFTYIREGAGPRHMVFSSTGRRAWVLNELDSSIVTLDVDTETGRATPSQILPSLPDTFIGNNRAADIVVSRDGRYVYVSNRGHDSVGTFSVNAETGSLKPVSWTPSSGKTPRAILIDEMRNQLLVANEGTDTIAVFTRKEANGELDSATQLVPSGSPVTLLLS